MDIILTGFIAGVLGTLMMDSLNHLFARYGVVSKIDVRIIGRMAVGWTQGRFRYGHPDEIEVRNTYFKTMHAFRMNGKSNKVLIGGIQ